MTFDPAVQHRVDQDAREWFIRLLDGDLGNGEIEAWQDWVEVPDHRAAYDRVADAWALSGLSSVQRPTWARLIFDRYYGAISVAGWRAQQASRLQLTKRIAGVVAVASVACGAWVWWDVGGGRPAQEIATARAEHKEAFLSDGSTVQLGAMTKIEVKYRWRRRAIEMDKGEALFEVAPDKSRPFVVETRAGSIRAVGTAFDVHVGTSDVTLVVTKGVVRFEPQRKSAGIAGGLEGDIRITAGQTLVLDQTGARLTRATGGMQARPAWLDGRLEFRDQDLSVVLEDVNRYAPAPIVIKDREIGRLTYTGSVQLDAIRVWASGLPAAFPLIIEDHPGNIVLRKKTSSPAFPIGAARSS